MGNARGTALLSVVLILTLLLPLAAHSVLQSHLDLLMARNLRDHTDALYVAEAGLDLTLAAIGASASLPGLLRGPDGIAGSADDGAPVSSPARLTLDAERRAVVRIVPFTADMIEIVSTAQVRNAASRTVSAIVRADAVPFTPAALFVGGAPRDLGLDPARFALAGAGPSAAMTETIVGLAFARDGVEARSGLDVVAISQQLTTAPGALHLPAAAAPPQLGTAAAPQLSIIDGDLVIAEVSTGAGVLVVRGALQVNGTLRFDGLLIVMRALAASTSSHLTLSGAVWQVSATDPLALTGSGSLHYGRAALLLADAAAPDILPRVLHVVGIDDAS